VAVLAAAAPIISTIGTIAGAAASVVGTGLSIYQAVKQPSVATIAGAAVRTLQLPGQLADFSVKVGFTEAVPESIAPALEVAQSLSQVLGKDLTNMVAQFAQTLKPLADLDPRLRDMIVPLIGIGGRSLPDLASVLSLTMGRPRRRYRDVPLEGFTGLDEDVQPLGEVIAETQQQTADQIATSIGGTSEELRKLLNQVGDGVPALRFPLIEVFKEQGFSVSSALNAISADVRAFFENVGSVRKYLRESVGDQIPEQMKTLFGVIVRGILTLVVDLLKEAVEVAHKPIADVLTPKFQEFLDEYQKGTKRSEPVEPGDAAGLAASMWEAALKFGVTAHAYAVAGELIHVTKHLGLPQFSAALVDAAAFGPIISNTIGRQISVGLGRATEWEARHRFRTVYPGLREAEQMYLERRISRSDYAERIRWEGWPEWWIKAYLALDEPEEQAVPFREPAPRELGIIWEDVQSDDAWILTMLKQQGYADPDAERIMRGVRLRSQKSLRSGLLSEVNTAFQDGLLYEEDLRRFLAPLNLREESLSLLLDRARLGLAANQAKKLLAAQRTLVEQDVIPLDQFRVSARALGFVDSQVEAEAAVIEAKAKGRLLKAERVEYEKEMRQYQEKVATVAEEEVRRGIITPEAFEAQLLQAGFEPQLAKASAELARVRQKPVLKLPEALTFEAQQQKVAGLIQDEILRRVQAGALDPGLAGLHLAALGIPTDEILALVRLAVARIPKAVADKQPSTESPQVREARQIRTQDAVARYQAGEIDEAGLRVALQAAGVAQDVLESTVARESSEKRVKAVAATAAAKAKAAQDAAAAKAKAEAQAERDRQAALKEIQALQRDIILTALRKGQLEAEDARVGLQMVGLSAEEADHLVTRELLRAVKPAA
jgi:hypothetical protein